MITPELLESCPIHKVPWGQYLWSKILQINFLLRGTKINIEGLDNIPTDRPVCIAMNHTDRYNSWPLQLYLLTQQNQYIVTWVKGKYYENPIVRFFLLATSNIPLSSRGYVLSSQFKQAIKRPPSTEEYRFIRNLFDEKLEISKEALLNTSPECRQFLTPSTVQRLKGIEQSFNQLSIEVVRLNRKALALGHHILVFPQGTRSKRLTKGYVGIAQMTQKLGLDIIPVGCNGSDVIYPGNSPFSSKGTVTYRVGKPIEINGQEIGEYRIEDDFIPFSKVAEAKYDQQFRLITDVVMTKINELLDEEYQFDPKEE
jgi:1-acyl-sn-glycerol-3-phosphate acyltransferase